MVEITKGSLYWDESSRGKTGKRGRWCAEIYIDGKRKRKRSTDKQKCIDFLNDWQDVEARKLRETLYVPTIHDRRFMVKKNNVATMEQRRQYLQDRITESQLTLNYWQTRDFADINRHIEKVVLPRLNVYCKRMNISGYKMQQLILECIGILYMNIDADVPIFSYERKLRAMLRYYQQYHNLGYYNDIPEPIHQATDALDVSVLATKFVVKKR